MIVSYACTINVSLALALALDSVVSYDHKWCSKLWHHLWPSFMIVTYDCNSFIKQAIGLQTDTYFLTLIYICQESNFCLLYYRVSGYARKALKYNCHFRDKLYLHISLKNNYSEHRNFTPISYCCKWVMNRRHEVFFSFYIFIFYISSFYTLFFIF